MSVRRLLHCIVPFLHIIFAVLAERDNYNETRQSIVADLLNATGYDSSIAPNYETDEATNVTVQLLIHNIYSVREWDMDYSVDAFFRQSWTDRRLSFNNRSSHKRLELDNKSMEKVWVPDTFFVNEKTAHVHAVTVLNRMMHIYRNGTVLYSMRVSLTLSCDMNLKKYPLDQQHCPIVIESYAYTIENIVFFWHPIRPIILQEVSMPQFEASTLLKYETCSNDYVETGEFACLKAQIHLRRKVGYYMVQVFVPSILIVILSWVSFWIEADSVPARISLGVLTVLTMTTQSAIARESLPHVSYVKAMDVWMATCLAFVFAAFLEYAYVKVLFRRRSGENVLKGNFCKEHTAVNGFEDVQRNQFCVTSKLVDKISRVGFPVFFATFNIIFWLYYAFADLESL